jgi:hypothetical protein
MRSGPQGWSEDAWFACLLGGGQWVRWHLVWKRRLGAYRWNRRYKIRGKSQDRDMDLEKVGGEEKVKKEKNSVDGLYTYAYHSS